MKLVSGEKDKNMDRQMDGRADRQIDGQTYVEVEIVTLQISSKCFHVNSLFKALKILTH